LQLGSRPTRTGRSARIAEQVLDVAWRPRAEIDLEEKPGRGAPPAAPVARPVYEETDLLVRRAGQAALVAEHPGRADDSGNTRRSWLEATDEADDTDVGPDDETTIVPSSPLTRAVIATVSYRDRDSRAARLSSASYKLQLALWGGPVGR
jgi:hypothetical protein